MSAGTVLNKWQVSLALPIPLITGVLAVQQLPYLPPPPLVLAALVAVLLLIPWKKTRWLAWFLLAAVWAVWHFGLQLHDRLDASLNGQVMVVQGVISDIPEDFSEFTRFRFAPVVGAGSARLPASLLVYWYRDRPALAVGQKWNLELQLRPPWGRLNFQGPDREKWFFYQGIGGLGTVRSGHLDESSAGFRFPMQQLRGLVKEKITLLMQDGRALGIVQALAIADRSGLSYSDRQLLVATGTSHLLAISGLHIGLAAAGGFWLVRLMLLLPLPPFRRCGLRAALVGGLLLAVIYAVLAGWGVSTQRAVLMIAVAMSASLLSRAISPSRAWLLALAAVLLFDPLAPLSVGFWFSFLAVAVLLLVLVPRIGPRVWWKTLLLVQAGIMLAMVPVSVYGFQLFSPLGFLANLLAIPWVSLVVVPLTLAAVAMLLISNSVAALLLGLAGKCSLALLSVLEFLSNQQGVVPLLPAPGVLVMLLAAVGGFLLLLPAGLPQRWLGPFLMLPLLLPPATRTQEQSLLVEVLDVGQGTAVLVSTNRHTLLYDSGPGDGLEKNLVSSVIAPAMANLGRSAPERIIISHGDLDHAGGMGTLRSIYPAAQWNVNTLDEARPLASCLQGLSWVWNDLEFEVLHPSSGLPYLGNNSSCVLSVKGRNISLLLAGDVSSAVENRLIGTSLSSHRILIVPHHGSLTSSSAGFIRSVQPEIAIATTGLGNRFGFPRDEVSARYRSAGVRFWSSGDCGAMRILLGSDGSISAASARRQRQRIWRWPAPDDCP